MRFKTYMRRIDGQGTVESVPFDSSHYAAVGVGYSPSVGMPVLEAFQLINKWNAQPHNTRYVYWLEA